MPTVGGRRPPRGYCAPISRAIARQSRCYEHLVVSPGSQLRTSTASSQPPNNTESHLGHQPNQDPAPEPNNSYTSNSPASADHRPNSSLNRDYKSRVNGRDKMTMSRRRRHTIGPPEELVYVRLETLGPNITALSTQAINERLVAGLLARLFADASAGNANRSNFGQNSANSDAQSRGSPLSAANFGNGNANRAPANDERAAAAIRAQILSSSSGGAEGIRLADKCRLSIERLVCRLAYPSCHFRASDVSALVRPPCREDCLVLRDVLCPNLNWPEFALQLRRAFNETLKSTINLLDLEAQADWALSGPIGEAQILHHYNARQSPADKKPQAGVVAEGHNLNSSSIHFYWPHERSIESCEHLPPLRPKWNHEAGQSSSPAAHNNRQFGTLDATPTVPRLTTHYYYRGRRHDRWWLWPTCSNARLTEQRAHTGPELKSDELAVQLASGGDGDCLKLGDDDGVRYEGHRNHTKSGLECQLWATQWPHKHSSSELLFDNMKEAQNYCRNPGGMELRPWCYTMDSSVRWEYCDIPQC